MTAQQMIEQFLLEYDYVSSYMAPGLEDIEIYDLLNKAQDAFVKQIYSTGDYSLIVELMRRDLITTSFPYDGISDLGEQIPYINGSISNAKAFLLKRIAGSEFTLLPSANEFKFYIHSRSYLVREYPYSGGQWVNNDFVDEHTAARFAVSVHNHPRFRNPKAFLETLAHKAPTISNYSEPEPKRMAVALIVVYDYYTSDIEKLELSYIKEPLLISGSQDCELSEVSQRRVISMAVNDAIETAKNERFQTQSVKQSNQ